MGRLRMELVVDRLPMRQPFAISGYVFSEMPAVVVMLSDGHVVGRGEANGVYYLNDGVPEMLAALEGVRAQVEAGLSRAELQELLPPCGARNAIDCALWELEAAQAGSEVWRLAGLANPRPLLTTMTAGAAEPAEMVKVIESFPEPKALKLKLTGEPELDIARVRAVRNARPDAWLGVDANQGYALDTLAEVLPAFVDCGVSLVEQPLPRGREAELRGFGSPIPLAADESVLSSADLPGAVGLFDVINIKLDKCGGLTEGLAMARRAREFGFRVMVGNMGASSWGMSAAFLVGQFCDVVDLDGPLALSHDRVPSVTYRQGSLWTDASVWGAGVAADAAASSLALSPRV